jgi:hypothetical protein
MAIRYAEVAREIMKRSYSLFDDRSFTTSELLELTEHEEYIAHILDEDQTRAPRLSSLDRALVNLIDSYRSRRLLCPLEESAVATNTYRPALRLPPGLPWDTRQRLVRFSLVMPLRSALHDITPRQFELICREVLRLAGCKGITVTRSSKDDGVDAMAELSMRGVLREGTAVHRMAGDVSFFVYLQAKAHQEGNPAGPDEIYETQGSLSALRNGFADQTISEELRNAMLLADYRTADPVLVVFATTSRLTAGASAKAADLGVLTLDGEQIAQLLIEHEYGVGQYGPGYWYVDPAQLELAS